MIHYYRYLFVKMKVFNYSELHISEVTSYKIPTLVLLLITKLTNGLHLHQLLGTYTIEVNKSITTDANRAP